jgi:hypothetical protein
MGGSQVNEGYPGPILAPPPSGAPALPACRCKPAEDNAVDLDVVEFNNLANYVNGTSFGCANPPDLHNTVLIDTAASCTLLTDRAPATSGTIPHGPITVDQPSGGRMTTTHAVDLLLCNLPASARLQSPIRCNLSRCRVQRVLPPHRVRSLSQRESPPLRVARPHEPPLAGPHHRQRLDYQYLRRHSNRHARAPRNSIEYGTYHRPCSSGCACVLQSALRRPPRCG